MKKVRIHLVSTSVGILEMLADVQTQRESGLVHSQTFTLNEEMEESYGYGYEFCENSAILSDHPLTVEDATRAVELILRDGSKTMKI
jgi:hypothetical protein